MPVIVNSQSSVTSAMGVDTMTPSLSEELFPDVPEDSGPNKAANKSKPTNDYQTSVAQLGSGITFEKILKLSRKRLADNIGTSALGEELTTSLARGRAQLQTEDQVDAYITRYGKMHFLKFHQIFKEIKSTNVFSEIFDIIDWGCGAGLSIVALADFCRNELGRSIESNVRRIVLVEPSSVALQRARIVGKHCFPESDVVSIATDFEGLDPEKRLYEEFWSVPRLHIFSNVLDLDMDKSKLYAMVANHYAQNDYYLCISPTYNNSMSKMIEFVERVTATIPKEDKAYLKEPYKINFTYEHDGAKATLTGLLFHVHTRAIVIRHTEIKNTPLLNTMLLRRDSTQPQQQLVEYVAKEFSPDYWECMFRPNLMGYQPDLFIVSRDLKNPAYLIQAFDPQSEGKTEVEKLCLIMDYLEAVKSHIYRVCSLSLSNELKINTDIYKIIKMFVYFGDREIGNDGWKNIKQLARQFKKNELEKQPASPQQEELALGDKTTLSKDGRPESKNIDKCYLYVEVMHNRTKFKIQQLSCRLEENIHNELLQLLQPFQLQGGAKVILTDEATQDLAQSVHGQKRKFSGIAGSGKTISLVERAISAYKRTHKPILILCYNITLRNYIESKLCQQWDEDVKPNRNQFRVINYHEFISSEIRNALSHGMPGQFSNYLFDDEKSLKSLASYFKRKYDVILIDEVQDFKYEWLNIIKDIFLVEDGEYVLVGDEKQNIYDRELGSGDEAKMKKTNLPGKFKRLKTCYRADKQIVSLLEKFQRILMSQKYDVDVWSTQHDGNSHGKIHYYAPDDVRKLSINEENPVEYVNRYYGIPFEEMTVLSTSKKHLQGTESSFREKHPEITIVSMVPPLNETDDKIYKLHFNGMAKGVKFSTVHSYKGWESQTIILFMEQDIDTKGSNERTSSLELLYVGISRARKNLFIFDYGRNEYGSILAKLCSAEV